MAGGDFLGDSVASWGSSAEKEVIEVNVCVTNKCKARMDLCQSTKTIARGVPRYAYDLLRDLLRAASQPKDS